LKTFLHKLMITADQLLYFTNIRLFNDGVFVLQNQRRLKKPEDIVLIQQVSLLLLILPHQDPLLFPHNASFLPQTETTMFK